MKKGRQWVIQVSWMAGHLPSCRRLAKEEPHVAINSFVHESIGEHSRAARVYGRHLQSSASATTGIYGPIQLSLVFINKTTPLARLLNASLSIS